MESVTAAGGSAAAAGGDEPIPHWPGEFISLGDHKVFIRTVSGGDGDGDTEPALCVHGLVGSSRNWTDVMELLRPELACDAVDLPGFGDSPPRRTTATRPPPTRRPSPS